MPSGAICGYAVLFRMPSSARILSRTKFLDEAVRRIINATIAHDGTGSRARYYPCSTRAMQVGAIVLFKIANIKRKYLADIADELFHHREAFRAAQRKIFRIPLSLCAPDHADARLERACFCPDRIILGKFRLFVLHA